jgi:uncharacterized OB-fold protein
MPCLQSGNGLETGTAGDVSIEDVPVTDRTLNMRGTGRVYSFSTMYSVPKNYEEQKPYTIALVQLDEGPIVTAQLTDVDHSDVKIGMPVEMVTRKLREEGEEGQIIYGYKFRPLLLKE